MLNRGYKFKLDPAPDQEELFRQFSGVVRLVYNLALEQRSDHWRRYRAVTGKHLNYVAQARELTALRAEFDWISAVSQTCQQQALRDLDKAFKNFYTALGGYPRPRKRGVNDSFRFQGREVKTKQLNGKWSAVSLPKIGWVKFRRTRELPDSIKNVTITRDALGWHVVFSCEVAPEATGERPTTSVGIDRGVANTLTLSTGERLSLHENIRKTEKRHRKAQRDLARKKRGSQRWAKQKRRCAALKARQARVRRDWHHRVTHRLSREFGIIYLEDLKIRNMTRSAKGTLEEPGRNVKAKSGLNRSILEQGWYGFQQMLDYKLEARGGYLVFVNPAYTSQTCNACGVVDKDSRKNQAEFLCRHCGHMDHADVNAAKNILGWNEAPMRVEAEVTPPMKRELLLA